jgi:enamine deaminase RidA (YjgF/YER057c/UK114 family)
MPVGQIDDRLEALGTQLPEPPGKAGMYVQTKGFSDVLCVSGCGPDLPGKPFPKGKLGELTVEEGQQAAANCILNALSILKRDLGTLGRIKSVVKMLVFVASRDDFFEQPAVANGASRLLIDVFGLEAGCPSRSAIGVNVLPGNIPVEVELMVQIDRI